MQWEQVLAPRMGRMRASEIRELLKLLNRPDIVSFAGGIPDPALFPHEAYQQAYMAALSPDEKAASLQYSISEGNLDLREWLAERMAKLGIPCSVDNILITSGSQQAIDYLGKLMIAPGDGVLLGWPTYLGALGAFNAYEPVYARLDPGSNLQPEAFGLGAGNKVKFAYFSSDFANPTGETISLADRHKLLDLADDLDIALVEDAAYQDLRYDGDHIPPVLALDVARTGHIDKCRTIYCGSFSKTLAPGLRIGWICAAKEVIARLVLMKQAADLHSSTINQIATVKVARQLFDTHVAGLRKVYQARRDHMLAALQREMPQGVSWTRPEGGMFIWLTLPAHQNATDLLAYSLKTEKVAFVPGRAFYADGSHENTLRLSFSLADEAMIDDGIARLGRLLRG